MNKKDDGPKDKDMKIRLEPHVKARLKKLAAREHRSATNLAYVYVVRGIESDESAGAAR